MATRQSITETIVALLVFLFLYTALSKLVENDLFRNTLRNSPLIGRFATTVAILLPASELFVSTLLILPRTRLLGLYLSLGLLSIFTIYLFYMVNFYPKLPCSCGGVISKLTWRNHIYFNLFFVLLSIIGIINQRKLKYNMKGIHNAVSA